MRRGRRAYDVAWIRLDDRLDQLEDVGEDAGVSLETLVRQEPCVEREDHRQLLLVLALEEALGREGVAETEDTVLHDFLVQKVLEKRETR